MEELRIYWYSIEGRIYGYYYYSLHFFFFWCFRTLTIF